MDVSTAIPMPAKRPGWVFVSLATGLVLIGWLFNTPAGLLGKADAIGYAVCHRIAVRSFSLDGRPLSLCARCTGMYLGALWTLVVQWRAAGRTGNHSGRTPSRKVLAVLGVLALAFIVDGSNSFASLLGISGLYVPNNVLRLFTGIGFGIGMAAILFPVFNQTVWIDWQGTAALGGIRSLGAPVGGGILLALAVLSGNPLLLYPLTLFSAAGVIALLSLVYATMLLVLLRRENRFDRPAQLVLPLLAGFTVAMLQIGASDLARFLLTGTWDGFHIG